METLILRIENLPAGQTDYHVFLIKHPEGDILAEANFPKNLTPHEWNELSNPLTAAQIHDSFAETKGDSNVLPLIGKQLYGLVGQGKIHDLLDRDGDPRRVLLDIKPIELRTLPWELMSRDGLPLMSGNKAWPFCRGDLINNQLPALQEPEWPLRVLVVVGSSANDTAVQAEEEVAAIIEAIREMEAEIDLLIMNRPDRTEILKAFEDPPEDLEMAEPYQGFRPHIFHFIGHGGIAGDDSFLILVTETEVIDPLTNKKVENSDPWHADTIRVDFDIDNKPRLVVLNACQTVNNEATGLWSVTDAFQKAGVPAVIGMRTVVTGEHARLFSSSLYQTIIKGEALDTAVVAGRRSVFLNVANPTKRLEWAAPTLHVSADPDTIVRFGQQVKQDERQRVRKIERLRQVRGLADRRRLRWYAWRNVSEGKPEELRKILVVVGDEEVGKTRLAYMFMERCALCGHDLRYVDMYGTENGDALEVLRRISEGDGSNGSLTAPLPVKAFENFKTTVQQGLGAPLTKNSLLGNAAEGDAQQILSAFQQGLEQSITSPPLVIILDHLQNIGEDGFRSFLKPHLITWCANRSNANIRLVLLLRQDEYDRFELNTVRANFWRIQLDDFAPERWSELAQEFAKRNLKRPDGVSQEQADKAINQLIDALGGLAPNARWKPVRFDRMRDFALSDGKWKSLLE